MRARLRGAGSAAATIAVALGFGATACGEPRAATAVYTDQNCRRLTVTDAMTERSVSGIEDLQIDPYRERLILSAYDRIATEEAIAAGQAAPQGNLYAIDMTALPEEAESIVASPLVRTQLAFGQTGFRPHGLTVGEATVATVNRSVVGGAIRPEIVTFAVDDTGALTLGRRLRSPAFCAANDLALDEAAGRLLVTRDRSRCPGWSILERLGRPGGSVIAIDLGADAAGADEPVPQERQAGLSFANGIAALDDVGLVVAETRGKRLRILPTDGPQRRIPLEGAPDNLTVEVGGRVVAALQPDLIAFARYRYGHRDRAASRIVAIDPGTGRRSLLYDGDGTLFSGATAAVLHGETLIAGSVRDHGLLVCRAGARGEGETPA